MRFRFEKAEHEEYGGFGWRMAGTQLDPLGGMGTTHDILEHFGEKTITIASEFRALGASLFVRKNYAVSKGHYRPDQGKHIASDMPDIIQHVLDGEHFETPPPTRAVDEETEQQITIAIREYKKEARDRFLNTDEGEDGLEAFSPSLLNKIRGWLRIGYRAAKRRYRGHDHYTMTGLFMDIEREADRYLKLAEYTDELVVDLNIKKATARVWLDHKEEAYA